MLKSAEHDGGVPSVSSEHSMMCTACAQRDECSAQLGLL